VEDGALFREIKGRWDVKVPFSLIGMLKFDGIGNGNNNMSGKGD